MESRIWNKLLFCGSHFCEASVPCQVPSSERHTCMQTCLAEATCNYEKVHATVSGQGENQQYMVGDSDYCHTIMLGYDIKTSAKLDNLIANHVQHTHHHACCTGKQVSKLADTCTNTKSMQTADSGTWHDLFLHGSRQGMSGPHDTLASSASSHSHQNTRKMG